MKDYYATLHVKPDASPDQIDAAYRRLMQRHHPNARSTPQALDRLRDLNEAWRVLSDPVQREAYDTARAEGSGYLPPAPVTTPRPLPVSSASDFGARRSTGSTCLVALGVLLVLMFALGILGWGLTRQLNFANMLADWRDQVQAVLPILPEAGTPVAQNASTPTPDPRCRDGCATPPSGCVVKGHIQPDGTRYFYLPNDQGYSDVVVNTDNGDRWFCALNDAQSAGWERRAPTPTPTLPPPPDQLTTQVARRAFIVCADNVVLRQGPGDDLPIVQPVSNGARLMVTGVNGDWSVVTVQQGTAYVRTDQLCAPTRTAPQATPIPVSGEASPQVPGATAPVAAASAAGSHKYPAPVLVQPSNGVNYSCKRPLTLEWSGSPLAENEYFLIESKPAERDTWTALADWTRDTTVTLNPVGGGKDCDALWWPNTGVYEWRVSIVTGNKTLPTYLSPFSSPSIVNYAH